MSAVLLGPVRNEMFQGGAAVKDASASSILATTEATRTIDTWTSAIRPGRSVFPPALVSTIVPVSAIAASAARNPAVTAALPPRTSAPVVRLNGPNGTSASAISRAAASSAGKKRAVTPSARSNSPRSDNTVSTGPRRRNPPAAVNAFVNCATRSPSDAMGAPPGCGSPAAAPCPPHAAERRRNSPSRSFTASPPVGSSTAFGTAARPARGCRGPPSTRRRGTAAR